MSGHGRSVREVAVGYHPSYRVLGVRIDALQIPEVIRQMEAWIVGERSTHFITATNVQSVMEARRDVACRETFAAADLSVPDGMPLVWLGRLWGHRLARRVYGPDLFWEFCRVSEPKGYSHFFYGGVPGTAERMVEELKKSFSGLKVAGIEAPPFRPLTPEEDAEVVRRINTANPDVLWIGLGCPKQERWMHEHRDRLRVPVMVGVGQAFNIYARQLKQAPPWMREHGLEWLFRLKTEPRRLARRYLVYNTQFLFQLFLEFARLRRFQ